MTGEPSVRERLIEVRERIARAAARSGRPPGDVLLVAVSKTQPVERLIEAMESGITVFGENYLQEAEGKIAAPTLRGAKWHFIGKLQGNKVKRAVSLFSCIHAVDSVRIAAEVSRRAVEADTIMPVLVEVNLGCEWSKAGVDPAALPGLVEQIAGMPGISLRGLMAIPPVAAEAEASRPHFARLRELMRDAKRHAGGGGRMTELSMGMSDDFETAIEEGATMVRIGTAIFGRRQS